jgi:hypothetical protein
VGKDAVMQTLGIAVINSFLLVFALVAIPMLIKINPVHHQYQKTYRNESTASQQLPYRHDERTASDANLKTIKNHNTDYSVYQ